MKKISNMKKIFSLLFLFLNYNVYAQVFNWNIDANINVKRTVTSDYSFFLELNPSCRILLLNQLVFNDGKNIEIAKTDKKLISEYLNKDLQNINNLLFLYFEVDNGINLFEENNTFFNSEILGGIGINIPFPVNNNFNYINYGFEINIAENYSITENCFTIPLRFQIDIQDMRMKFFGGYEWNLMENESSFDKIMDPGKIYIGFGITRVPGVNNFLLQKKKYETQKANELEEERIKKEQKEREIERQKKEEEKKRIEEKRKLMAMQYSTFLEGKQLNELIDVYLKIMSDNDYRFEGFTEKQCLFDIGNIAVNNMVLLESLPTYHEINNPYNYERDKEYYYYYCDEIKVVQWTSEGLLVKFPYSDSIFFINYVWNIKTITDKITHAYLHYDGTYTYINTLGAECIVPSFSLYFNF